MILKCRQISHAGVDKTLMIFIKYLTVVAKYTVVICLHASSLNRAVQYVM